ncbi:MAG: DMT family transporter [Bryobacteraceae bacterium]
MKPQLWHWLAPALMACLWWGLFGFLAKLGSADVNAYDMQVLFTVGTIPIAIYILVRRAGMQASNKGRFIGAVIGIFAGVGGIAYFAAMARGKASIVGPVTSLFPLVTVLLATTLLKERLNRVQMAGIVLALISAALLAT